MAAPRPLRLLTALLPLPAGGTVAAAEADLERDYGNVDKLILAEAGNASY